MEEPVVQTARLNSSFSLFSWFSCLSPHTELGCGFSRVLSCLITWQDCFPFLFSLTCMSQNNLRHVVWILNLNLINAESLLFGVFFKTQFLHSTVAGFTGCSVCLVRLHCHAVDFWKSSFFCLHPQVRPGCLQSPSGPLVLTECNPAGPLESLLEWSWFLMVEMAQWPPQPRAAPLEGHGPR